MKPKHIPLAAKPPMPQPHHDSYHHHQMNKKTTSSSNLASNRPAGHQNTSASSGQTSLMSSSHTRKVSESKIPVGFLHTELRAQRRNEFDAIMKEKERLAAQQRQMYEQQKQQQEQEHIQRIRSRSLFKSQPIRHYKPIEIKPSERPLTSPISPHLGSLLPNNLSVAKKNSMMNESHDDLENH